jgi:hypothetical protein
MNAMKLGQSTSVCNEFIENLREQYKRIKQNKLLQIDERNVFPVVRDRLYIEMLEKDQPGQVPHLKLNGDLRMVYVEDRNGSFIYLTETMLKTFQSISYNDVSDVQKLAVEKQIGNRFYLAFPVNIIAIVQTCKQHGVRLDYPKSLSKQILLYEHGVATIIFTYFNNTLPCAGMTT